MTTILRRIGPLDRLAAVYAAAYFGWMAAHFLGFPLPGVVANGAFYPLGLAIGWVNWRNSRVSWLDARTRLAWRLLAAAALVLWASGTTWAVWLAAGGSPVWAARIDRVAFAQYVLAIAGYLAFPGRAFPAKGGPRFLLDVALISIAGLVLASYVGLSMHLVHGPTLAIVESCLDWALFVVATVGCTQKRDPIVRRVLILLLASNLVSLMANYLHTVLPVYHAGDPVDALWFSAWALRWIGGRAAWHHYRAVEGGASAAASPQQDYRSNPFAYVLVAGAFLLLFEQILAGKENHQLVAMLTVAATALACLLILRQFAELEENRHLFQARIEGEKRFRSLVHHSSDVVMVVNGQGVVSYVSPSAATVFGDDTRVRPGVVFGELLAPEDARIAQALVAGSAGAPARFEASMQTAPDRWREVEAVSSDLRNDPAVEGIVVSCRDVSDRNEIERHLRQTQKLDAVGVLAGGLAHDLNNVLSIIRGYAELLRSEIGEAAEATGDLDQIITAVDRATGVTGKVLAFSRKQPGLMKSLDLNAVVRELEPMLRHLMKDQVEVRLVPQPGLWLVRADEGQMEQVVVNLATNARDAMPDGGALSIATENRTVTGAAGAGGLASGDYVALTVSDQGTGMSAAVAARIFEPFFSTKPKNRGVGLGLSIVHGIVTEMGGRVLVDTAEGRGSRFTVVLPRGPARATPGPP